MKDWKDESWRGRIKMLIFALVPVTVLVLVSEGLTALAIYRDYRIESDALSGRQSYVFRMGLYPWSHESRTLLNSLGFPDEEFVNILPKGECTHVVFVGDSYTFGDGVDREDNYVSLIRAWSAKAHPHCCIRFFNIGERATTIAQHLQNLDETWDLLEPDIVVLNQYQNDLTDLTRRRIGSRVRAGSIAPPTEGRAWSAPRVSVPVIGSSIVRWLSYQTFALLTERGIHYNVLERWSVLADPKSHVLVERLSHQYTALFDEAIARARTRGAELGVAILPSKFDVLAGRSPEEGFFLDLAAERQLPAISLFATFDNARRPYPYLMYDGHLNRHGNYLVARALMSWLFEKEPAPFATLRKRSCSAAARKTANPALTVDARRRDG